MDAQIAKLKEWVDASDNIVFFGGAGVSTESGIPDFRSVDGLYNQQYKYPPETILSHTFFMAEPEEFFRFYRAKMLALDAEPNAAHLKLAEWERMGKCRAVVTQNIDGLHQKAGSKEVLELHGSVPVSYTHLDVYKRQVHNPSGHVPPKPAESPFAEWASVRHTRLHAVRCV